MLTSLVVIIIFALALQCYPVSLGLSIKKNPSKTFGFIIILSIIQTLMLLLGFLLGNTFMDLMEGFKSIIMFLGFILVGIRMFFEVISVRKGERTFAITTFSQITLISIALGINAFLVGIIIYYLNINIYQILSLIAIISFIVSLIGSLTDLRKVNLYLATLFSTLGGIIMVFAAIYFTFFYF